LAGFAQQKISQVMSHPLSNQAIFQLGKLTFWDWVEQHHTTMLEMAQKCFSKLLLYYPEHKLLRRYAVERIVSKKIIYNAGSDIPAWAFYADQALQMIKETIHYWVDKRQAENGEFGGKYDDDVEMLRWWPIAAMALNDPKTLSGMRRLVDGIWNSDWITNGYSTKLRDVEHAAEPVADTQPMMIGLDYGNPIYVERCMKSIQGLKDLWTGINAKGHRHFKSSWYSYKAIDQRPPRDCDVPMNTRTVKAARWLAWYNQHPQAMQFLKEWGDAWLEDCLRTDKGKPYGIVPSAIRFEDDAIGGHAGNWHHPGLFWRYFDFHGGTKILTQFLSLYDLTSDKRYLEPIELALELVKKYNDNDLKETKTGSEKWVSKILRNSPQFAETIEKWRLITGRRDYDPILLNNGSDYLKFRLTGDLKYIESGNKQVLDGININNELLTMEGYFTDRIEIGNLHKNQVLGAAHLESIYTGSSLYEGFYPFHSVTWKGFGDGFCSIVSESSNKHLRLLVFNLNEEPVKGEVLFWRLDPGRYVIEQGPENNGDKKLDVTHMREEVLIKAKPTSWQVAIPSKETQIINIKRIESLVKTKSDPLPDLAITKFDMKISNVEKLSKIEVIIPVHNIGTAKAENFDIEFSYIHNNEKILIEKKQLREIEAPLDLEAKIVEVAFLINLPNDSIGDLFITVDPGDQVKEITEINNQVRFNGDDLFK
jgi:hypothetical protein